jgi:serine/threonine protein kinase/Tfp pilus assembly protein PilF
MEEAPSTKAMEIFSDAVTSDPAGRAAFLESACAGDEKLRAEVESLLATQQRMGEFLNLPTMEIEEDGDPAEAARLDAEAIERGDCAVGRYQIDERMGEGGFGVVYRARQTHPIRREVALKILKLGMDTRQVIARFESERQALAMMDHPNIAKVFDAGATDSGRPYFVMELVHGVPITEYCDKNGLSPRQRLELFVQVCRAVQHAHTKGVIHRDIKPSNVLVTLHEGAAVPKVIDFGVAKAVGQQALTDRTLLTNVAQLVGTPLYMSPEQAEMTGVDVDTRSDVYSLGVLLYELLTGTTPVDKERFRQAAFDEVRRIIREEEPPPPSTRLSSMGEKLTMVSGQRQADPKRLPRMVRGELDWIVMKALEKDRNQRYETANAFARDVERFLHDEAVLARPQSGVYRFRKLVRRHKLKFAAAAAIAASLLLATGFSTWMFLQERGAHRRAVLAEHEQERLRTRAETAHANESRLRQHAEAQERTARAEAAKREQVAEFMKEMLRGAAPFVAQGRDTTILREIVDKTAQRVGSDLQAQPDVEAELRVILGEVYRDLGEFKKAEEMLRRALKLKREHFGGQHGEVAIALNSLAAVLLSQRRLDEAESLHREALAIRRNFYGPNHPLVAETLDNLGLVLHREWKNDEAEPLYREALAIRRQAFGNEDPAVALSLTNLATLLRVEGRLDESETLHREALAIRRNVLSNEHPDVAISINGLGNLLRDQGRLKEAEEMHREALAIRRKIYPEGHPYIIQSLGHLAQGLFWQDKSAEAEACLDEGIAMDIKRKGRPPGAGPADDAKIVSSSKANTFVVFAREANRQGKVEIEERAARRAIELQPENGNAHYHLGHALEEKGRLDEAIAEYRRCVVLEPTQVMPRKKLIDGLTAKGLSAAEIETYLERLRVESVAVAAKPAAATLPAATTRPASAPVRATAPAPAADDLLALGRESPEGVARAVEKARSTDLDAVSVTPLKRLIYGEYLVLGGDAEKGAGVIRRAIDEAGIKGKVPLFYHKSLGWALLASGRREEAASAFRRALPSSAGTHPTTTTTQPAGADPDEWTAAYFIDQITQEQFTSKWDQTKLAAMVWFYVGHRAEMEGRLDAAMDGYRKSVALAAAVGGNQSGNWAAYRMEVLTRKESRRGKE